MVHSVKIDNSEISEKSDALPHAPGAYNLQSKIESLCLPSAA
jgi:hypothetical protein